jgi:two-component system OmpR family response regulator
MRILMIEDNKPLSDRMKGVLLGAGFVVDHAGNGEKGWALGEGLSYDAALLDLNLPKLSGIEVLKRWRASGQDFPVMIVTARTGWRERVAALNAGADDYLEKPFEPDELIARIRCLLRRSAGKSTSTLTHNEIMIDTLSGEVKKDGKDIEVTALESRILTYLMHRPTRIVSQNELMDHIYSIDTMRDSNTVEVYIARLRRKFGRKAIRTVRGMGYRMG